MIDLLRNEPELNALAWSYPGIVGLGAGLTINEGGEVVACIALFSETLAAGKGVAMALAMASGMIVRVEPAEGYESREGRDQTGDPAMREEESVDVEAPEPGLGGTSTIRLRLRARPASTRLDPLRGGASTFAWIADKLTSIFGTDEKLQRAPSHASKVILTLRHRGVSYSVLTSKLEIRVRQRFRSSFYCSSLTHPISR